MTYEEARNRVVDSVTGYGYILKKGEEYISVSFVDEARYLEQTGWRLIDTCRNTKKKGFRDY